jgi:hypothetical protein
MNRHGIFFCLIKNLETTKDNTSKFSKITKTLFYTIKEEINSVVRITLEEPTYSFLTAKSLK